MEEGRPPQPQRFLDRPVRSLLEIKIGTVLKAYIAYVAIGLGIALIGLVVVIQHRSHTTVKVGAAPGTISWKLGAGKTVTPDEYGSVEKGARLAAVRKRFGEPATTEPNPLDEASGATQTCLGYRSSASDSTLFLFCFAGGRLIDKQIF